MRKSWNVRYYNNMGIWWIWALFILHWMRVKRKLTMQRAISSVRSRPSVILGLMQVFGIIIMGRELSEGRIFFIQYKLIHSNR